MSDPESVVYDEVNELAELFKASARDLVSFAWEESSVLNKDRVSRGEFLYQCVKTAKVRAFSA